jgi:hypothetical protein
MEKISMASPRTNFDDIMKKNCKICDDGEGHYHYEEVLLDLFQPITPNYICHCGRVDVHYHYTKVSIWIEGKKDNIIK